MSCRLFLVDDIGGAGKPGPRRDRVVLSRLADSGSYVKVVCGDVGEGVDLD